jgi:heptosyltransferase III
MHGSASPAILALFPGGLGDLLCCWPALNALRHSSGATLTLVARTAWFEALPSNAVTPLSIDRREVADLFASGPLTTATRSLCAGFTRIESWTGHGDDAFAARLAEASGIAVGVHPFRALRPAEHAAQYYARCLGVAPIVEPLPVRASAAQWADALWRRHDLGGNVLVIHAGSGSARKNWEGMGEVAAAWRARGAPVIALGGPAEAERHASVPHDVAVRGAPLDRVAALLARAARYLGNDSGISHLAGQIGARGVALFGPTDPRAWRPLGDDIRVLHAPTACARCGANRFCTHRLSVEAVVDALGPTQA